MLDPQWITRHADSFDVLHLHFGFDARSPADLTELVAELQRLRKPLVFTVHDLRNPHHDDGTMHDAQLDVLVPAADALITLTNGAAAAIARRWGRHPVVLPHPHVVPESVLSRPRPCRDDRSFVVGVHVKSLRSGMDPLAVIGTLRHVVGQLPGARLRIDAHRDVMTPGAPRHAPELAAHLHDASRDRHVGLHVHDFFSDVELWDYLQQLDVSVLPYRFGTHSGWLEACHDLGTKVIAPDCGFYTEQRPCIGYRLNSDSFDAASLADAVRRAYAEPSPRRPGRCQRLEERRLLAARHHYVYAEAMRPQTLCG